MKANLLRFLKQYYPLLLLPLAWFLCRYRVEENLRGVIWSDSEGYYIYLPAAFVIRDFHKVPEGSMNLRKNDRGEVIMKYTCGVALFEMPFFLIAKAYCDARGIPKNEIYNIHYARSVALSGYMACFLGLFFLRKALRRYFSETAVFLTLLAVFLGTNLFHYTTKEPGMSHVYSFLLFAFLVWHTPRYLENPSWKNALLLGGCLGWIVLIRPTGGLAVLFILLYDVYSWRDLRVRFRFFLSKVSDKPNPKLVAIFLGGFAFLFLQMLYWREMTGNWLYYSYDNETFEYWKNPNILEVLFDIQNGLFVYSPIVLFSILGIILGWREKRWQAPALGLIFILATYAFASWWAWWFGGALGHRCYVEYYALLALPMAAVFQKILDIKNGFFKTLALSLVAALVVYGCRLAFLYSSLGGPWDGPEWRWNLSKLAWVLAHFFKY